MEKICEFCAALRPIVFCKADSAFLCLSCDAKVHSANALSNRHLRCLVCESCRGHPAYIRCLRHRLLLCTACDATLHHNNAKLKQHQRRMVSSFTGSPSAKQFAILWGFDVNQLPLQEQLSGPSTSSISAGSVVSHREEHKMAGNDGQQSCLIMQQIIELNKLQLNGGNNPSSAIRGRGQAHSSSSCVYKYNTMGMGRIDECLEDTMMGDSSGASDDLQALKDHHFLPPPLSQSEYFSSYTSTALESNQFWTQNLEEPRVSEELNGFDVFKMPQVDITFPNFDELLRGNQDLSTALLQDDESQNSDAHSDLSAESKS